MTPAAVIVCWDLLPILAGNPSFHLTETATSPNFQVGVGYDWHPAGPYVLARESLDFRFYGEVTGPDGEAEDARVDWSPRIGLAEAASFAGGRLEASAGLRSLHVAGFAFIGTVGLYLEGGGLSSYAYGLSPEISVEFSNWGGINLIPRWQWAGAGAFLPSFDTSLEVGLYTDPAALWQVLFNRGQAHE